MNSPNSYFHHQVICGSCRGLPSIASRTNGVTRACRGMEYWAANELSINNPPAPESTNAWA
ncbi:unnamed protein product, partial [Staurois parvus]